jgi:hypothetical protein
MWDLIDGAEGIADRDHDVAAIGLSGVMRVYSSFHDDPVAFPGIHTVLERAVSLHLVTDADATRLVRHPVNQGFAYPMPAPDAWPIDLALPSEAQGLVDGHTQPAPSGGRNVPSNGLDAIKTYRIHVPHRGMVYVDLTIDGPGTQASGTDLDLQLFTRNLDPVAQSNGERSEEHIRRILESGTYIIFVRDGDAAGGMTRVGARGNRANFTLRVRQSNDFH